MKTTIDIPDNTLQASMAFTGAKTKREAVLAAMDDFNRRQRMARLARHLGTCRNLVTPEELQATRQKE